jgi:hypothetical protein
MRVARQVLLSFTAAVLISGCVPTSNAPAELNQAVTDATKKLDQLSGQLDELKKTNTALEKRVSILERNDKWRDFVDTAGGIAYLTPGTDGYSIVKIDVGFVTVSLENVQPYANGTRVALRFGNPTGATLTGGKATFEWGKVDAQGNAQNETAKSRDVTFTESFAAGGWTTVHVVLEGVPPSELGFVRVRDFSHQGMSLSLRRN